MENLRSARGGTLASKNRSLNKRQFIQYEPALAAELNETKPRSQSVSARMLTLLYKRLSFWSRYAKHIHNGRRYFWKSIDELSEELQYSQKQVSRGLKALVELGLIIREKLNKHNWKHTYYYYLPHSVHIAEEVSTNSRSSRGRSSYRDTSSNRNTRPSSSTYRARRPEPAAVRPEHQQFIPEERRQQEAAGTAAGDTGAPVEGSGVPVAAGVPIGTPTSAAGTGFGVSSSCRTTATNSSAALRTKCPHLSIEDNSILNIHLKQIVEKCLDYGKTGVKPLTGRGIGFAA